MTVSDLSERLAAGEVLPILDVRTEREFAGGHVPGSMNIPFNRIGARIGDLHLDRNAPVIVYCGHGPRAWIAARALRRAGFTVDYLKGHMTAWRRAGLAEER